MAIVRQQLDPEGAQFLAVSFPALVKNGTNFPVVGLAYDAAAQESAFWRLYAAGYGSGNLTVDLDWYADTVSSGDVIWKTQIAAITPNIDTQDVETKALASASSATQSHLGTTGQRLHRSSIAISNLDSLAVSDEVWIVIARDATNASDTMIGDAILVGVTVSYSDT